jgi:hypothetical protein
MESFALYFISASIRPGFCAILAESFKIADAESDFTALLMELFKGLLS